MDASTLATVVSTVAVVVLAAATLESLYVSRRNYPPGPPKSPFVGNAFNFPTIFAYLKHAEWAKTYGPVIHMSAFGRHTVVLNDYESCRDLLERRGAVYSSRPDLPYATMLGFIPDVVAVLVPMSERCKNLRKILNTALDAKASRSYLPLQESSVRFYLRRMLDHPADYYRELNLMMASMMGKITYGIRVDSADDRIIPIATLMNEALSDALFSVFWVDHLPFLRYFLRFFPKAERERIQMVRMITSGGPQGDAFGDTKKEIAAGTAIPSFVSTCLESQGQITGGDDEIALFKSAAGVLFGAAFDTTIATMSTFVYLMGNHPHIQKKAQEELDKAVGSDRLATTEDQENLPYMNALLKELVRFTSGTPMGVPHSVERDDVYKGMFIPKGATVISNIWAILHDPKEYPEPMAFKPERHLGANPPADPSKFAFGFGRRACPGKDVALATIWTYMASTLQTFDIKKTVDDSVEITFTPGLTRRPIGFEAEFVPRSTKAAELARSE